MRGPLSARLKYLLKRFKKKNNRLVFFASAASNIAVFKRLEGGGGAVAQSVELTTPGEEVLGSIPTVTARSLLVGSVSV